MAGFMGQRPMLSETVATAIYPGLRMRALQLTHGDRDRAEGLLQEAFLRLCQHREPAWTAPAAGRYARLTLRSLACKRYED
jgi:DNA-directed RNA polymerase specialized sigma24 family protein